MTDKVKFHSVVAVDKLVANRALKKSFEMNIALLRRLD